MCESYTIHNHNNCKNEKDERIKIMSWGLGKSSFCITKSKLKNSEIGETGHTLTHTHTSMKP